MLRPFYGWCSCSFSHCFQIDRPLRRVVSEISPETDDLMGEIEEQMIECECCGMSEECTPKYISRVKTFFCGKWVCGLCSEAVKEQLRKNPAASLREALESHMALCMNFHSSIRANPKLSFASSMRDIARRSSQKRTWNSFFGAKMGRIASCGARFDLKVDSSPIQ